MLILERLLRRRMGEPLYDCSETGEWFENHKVGEKNTSESKGGELCVDKEEGAWEKEEKRLIADDKTCTKKDLPSCM